MCVHRAPTVVGLLCAAALVMGGCASSHSEQLDGWGDWPAPTARLPVGCYFVGDLLAPIPEFVPPPVVARVEEDVWSGKACTAGAETSRAELLERVIKQRVTSAEPWEASGGEGTVRIVEREGLMLVRQTAEGQAQVADLLKRIRAERGNKIRVESWLIQADRADTETLSRWLHEATGSNPRGFGKSERERWLDPDGSASTSGAVPVAEFLTDEQMQTMMAEVKKLKGASVIFAPQLLLWSGQRAWFGSGARYAQELPRVDKPGRPNELVTVMTGSTLEVKATVSADQRYVQLDLHPEVTEISGDEEATACSAGGEQTSILPTVRVRHLATSVSVPEGQVFVMRQAVQNERLVGVKGVRSEDGSESLSPVWVAAGETDATPEKFLWLLVKPTIVVTDEEESGAATETR